MSLAPGGFAHRNTAPDRRVLPALLTAALTACAPAEAPGPRPDANGIWHVHPGQEIQPILEAAAADPDHKTVHVHEGVYRPAEPGQAFLWFNERHDGITLEAIGDVTLTAANPDAAPPEQRGYPSIVNHVVYFGHGVGPDTVLRGFRITGANGYVTRKDLPEPIETSPVELPRGLFYYLDGGAIKIWGRSFPTLESLHIDDNFVRLCAAGISIQHENQAGDQAVTIRDCVFSDNRCPATGVAVDVLPGSSVRLENCLFVRNVGNTGLEEVARRYGLRYNPEHGTGALTVFPGSRAEVRRSTFAGNWNGADDAGLDSIYEDCLFYRNNSVEGSLPGAPFELDIRHAAGVRGCFFHGDLPDLRGTIDPARNELEAPDPELDASFVPQSPAYAGVGYRPRS